MRDIASCICISLNKSRWSCRVPESGSVVHPTQILVYLIALPLHIISFQGSYANYCRTVSRWDRLLVFGGLNLAAVALFVVCFTLLPILSLRPRKFAILYVTTSHSLLHKLCQYFRASTLCLLSFGVLGRLRRHRMFEFGEFC